MCDEWRIRDDGGEFSHGACYESFVGEFACMSNAFVCLFKVPKRVFHSFHSFIHPTALVINRLFGSSPI